MEPKKEKITLEKEREDRERMKKIREQIHKTSIHISTDLREEDKDRFKALCSQFGGNHAIGLRWLLDLSEGFFANEKTVMDDKINHLAERLSEVEELLGVMAKQEPEESKRKIRMLDGSFRSAPKLEE